MSLALSTFAADDFVGAYRLVVPDEVRSLAKMAGKQEPSGWLRLNKGRRFLFEDGTLKREGDYRVEGGQLTLSFPDRAEMSGQLSEKGIKFGGLYYELQSSVDLVGTWVVRKGELPDRSIKLTFKKDGSFQFVCVGAKSAGKYQLENGKLVLLWTTVDSEPVELGSMRKELRLSSDGGSFDIDSYHYVKD